MQLWFYQTAIGAVTTKATIFARTLIPPQHFLAGTLASSIAASTYIGAQYIFSTQLKKLSGWKNVSLQITFIVMGILFSSVSTPWLAHYLLGYQITRTAAAALSAISLTLPFIITYRKRFNLFLGASSGAAVINILAAHAIRLISSTYAPSRTMAGLSGLIGAAVFSTPFSQVDSISSRKYRSILAIASLIASICATYFLMLPLALKIRKPIEPLTNGVFAAWLPSVVVIATLFNRF
ncbi:MAG: hypothetical protein AAF443_02785 [Chlamydiota bacterium]